MKILAAFALTLAGATAANATTIYTVNQTIGLGSVIGTIETNGTVGVLAASDITGFDLLVSGPGASVQLTQATSILVNQGGKLSATASDLSFDYDGSAGYLLFQFGSFGTGQRYYCNSSVAGACFQGASAIPDSFNSPSAQVEQRFGTRVIASAGASAVPEPAIWMSMIGGFGLIGTAMRRRQRTTVRFA